MVRQPVRARTWPTPSRPASASDPHPSHPSMRVSLDLPRRRASSASLVAPTLTVAHPSESADKIVPVPQPQLPQRDPSHALVHHYVGIAFHGLLDRKRRRNQLAPGGLLPPTLAVTIYNGRDRWTAMDDVRDLVEPTGGWLADHQPKLVHKALDLRALTGQPLPEHNVVSCIADMEADSSAGNVSRVVREVLDTYPGPEHKRLREAFREWVLGAAQSWGIGEEVMKQVESLKEAGMVYAGVEELKEMALREAHATLVCRQTRLKFGTDTAERLSKLLEEVSDPERIARIGDRIIQCETGAELLARAREV